MSILKALGNNKCFINDSICVFIEYLLEYVNVHGKYIYSPINRIGILLKNLYAFSLLRYISYFFTRNFASPL